jgi:hypothetical protein
LNIDYSKCGHPTDRLEIQNNGQQKIVNNQYVLLLDSVRISIVFVAGDFHPSRLFHGTNRKPKTATAAPCEFFLENPPSGA